MKNQGTYVTVRGAVFGIAILGLVGVLAGCASGGVNDGGGGGGPRPMLKPSYASFTIVKDASDPSMLAVSPDDGDAWLEAEPRDPTDPNEKINKIVWTSTQSFDIKFVQIDDPEKNPNKKFGPTQQNGWKAATCGTTGTPCVFDLPLFKGNGKRSKEIRGAKYMLRSPSGCDHKIPGPDCTVLDPVIIVRY